MTSSDEHLVQQARTGDKTAFGQLVERHYQSTLSVAIRLVSDSDMVRQLAQEALLQAYLSLGRLQKDTAFKSWLYGIVLNICRQHLRHNQQRRNLADWILLDLKDIHDPGPDAKDQVILTDESGQHNLPLPIDPTSAQALMLAVSGSPTVGTPTFTQRLIDTLDATLESVTLNQLPENVLCAELNLKQNNQIKQLDARPGEALALAASIGVPITADPEIIQSLAQTSDPLASSQPAISLSLPNDSIKGKIVGKNGRNIITFEILTGVKLIINATPQVVHIVSPDPQKREIAKRALSNLISSDRINPDLIAEAVTNAQNSSDDPKQSTDVQLFFTLPNTRPSPAVVPVSNEQVKKRFIGSKGRNALAFEAATGVHAYITDAIPEKIVLWSTDPDKLEVARLSLERIVTEETITPELITEIVSACKAQHYLQA